MTKPKFSAPNNPAIALIPVAVSVFRDELHSAPQSWAAQAYPKLIHYNELPKGGHIAPWDQPNIFAEDIRAALGSPRR